MARLKVAETKDYFTLNGEPFFYFADVVWRGVTNATPEEWEDYLNYRKQQGFNSLQISIFHEPGMNGTAFKKNAQGFFDYSDFNHDYFKIADKYIRKAKEKGFLIALVGLWLHFVPGTSKTRDNPENIMPLPVVKEYGKKLVDTFGKYEPIYLISADTSIKTEETARHYMTLLETIKSLDPEGLTTMHLNPHAILPERFEKSELVDFYMDQSGHQIQHSDFPYSHAQMFYNKPIKRPIVNGEPCFEGHGHAGRYGRFDSFYARMAFWQSILSGGKAGYAYGAHGIWNFYKGTSSYLEGFAKKPFYWRTALQFKGANDVSFGVKIFESINWFELEPRNDLLLTPYEEIRISADNNYNTIVIYIPYSNDVEIDLDLSNYSCEMIELENRNVVVPNIEYKEGKSLISMIPYNSDSLFIAKKCD